MVQWDTIQLVFIAGYCLNVSFELSVLCNMLRLSNIMNICDNEPQLFRVLAKTKAMNLGTPVKAKI